MAWQLAGPAFGFPTPFSSRKIGFGSILVVFSNPLIWVFCSPYKVTVFVFCSRSHACLFRVCKCLSAQVTPTAEQATPTAGQQAQLPDPGSRHQYLISKKTPYLFLTHPSENTWILLHWPDTRLIVGKTKRENFVDSTKVLISLFSNHNPLDRGDAGGREEAD